MSRTRPAAFPPTRFAAALPVLAAAALCRHGALRPSAACGTSALRGCIHSF
jgi:hypothetical protein